MPKEWPDILTPEQVAEYLQLQLDEVITLLLSEQLPGSRVGGKWRIRKVRLDEWIDSQTVQMDKSHETPTLKSEQEEYLKTVVSSTVLPEIPIKVVSKDVEVSAMNTHQESTQTEALALVTSHP
jgi:excisionase family DNA binding protein